jgi:hypothetical protein
LSFSIHFVTGIGLQVTVNARLDGFPLCHREWPDRFGHSCKFLLARCETLARRQRKDCPLACHDGRWAHRLDRPHNPILPSKQLRRVGLRFGRFGMPILGIYNWAIYFIVYLGCLVAAFVTEMSFLDYFAAEGMR